MRILVAERNPALAAFLQRSFQDEHYLVDLTVEESEAKSLAEEREYAAAVLDLNLAMSDGFAVLRHVRAAQPQLPILILTNCARPEERVQIFDLGADDLVLKPFAFTELSARVRALLRRGGRSPEITLRIEDLELSRVDRTVARAGRPIVLTPKEFALLEYLMRNAGQRVTRAQIIEHVWNLSFDTMTNVVDVYINYLRKKIDAPSERKLIRTIRGVGYQIPLNASRETAA
jgi:two-component system copper resistance phosphate regulon response regulator CusR